MGLPLLEELVEFREDSVIFGNPLAPDKTSLKNVLVDGKRYDMRIESGVTAVYQGDILVAKEKGCVRLERR